MSSIDAGAIVAYIIETIEGREGTEDEQGGVQEIALTSGGLGV